MYFRDACIPVRLGWSSPFARWQGPLAELSSIDLAVNVTACALSDRGLPASEAIGIVFGVHPTSAEGLAKLAPVDPGGVVTYGTQTHPADGTED